ncbi:MAG: hypothetical protein JWQ76_1469 [Ramlibacter sp.]|nr:hypothetical protein [Ramlibacter sp.]
MTLFPIRGAIAAMALFCAAAHAQPFPSKPIHIIVPFATGGGTDALTRIVAQQMSEQMKVPIVIENRPGGGGTLGTAAAARAPADGYTLHTYAMSTPMMSALYKNLSFDPVADFAPVGLIGTSPFVLIMNKDVPAETLPEMLALARAKPGSLSYGSAGNGSVSHIGMELFTSMAGVDIQHIPYKGNGPALADLLGGHLTLLLDTVVSATPHIRSNSVRGLAVTSAGRSPLLPNLPTVNELGPKGYEMTVWYGFVAPKGTPMPILHKLNEELNKALASPALRQRYALLGAEPTQISVEDFGKLMVSDEKKWTAVIKKANIPPIQ